MTAQQFLTSAQAGINLLAQVVQATSSTAQPATAAKAVTPDAGWQTLLNDLFNLKAWFPKT
jgi:hypothetical protein